MESNGSHHNHHKFTLGGLLITLGIIYGDIGTSPLYVMKTVVAGGVINKEIIFGAVSLVFWILTIQTTFKYITMVLRADNNGEGGIFSLYTLVRRRERWLIYPAMIGGCSALADGMITPPISVSSAIEGLESLPMLHGVHIPVVAITVTIISLLFVIQQFGTAAVGRFFGPVMTVWFSMLCILGLKELASYPSIIWALNPYYGIKLLMSHPSALILMGAVFLCTTGAEALYADLGHCGIRNIRTTWIYVKFCLVINYLGQAAWMLKYEGQNLPASAPNPFFGVMPDWFLPVGIIIATLATIIASQAMISGSFTLISEAIRLNLLPKMTVVFPSQMKGQLYIPAVNWTLLAGCIAVTLYFQKSSNMEAAYGLSVTLTMLVTTILLANYFVMHRIRPAWVWMFLVFYLIFEGCFFSANLLKFKEGGFITVLMAALIFALMFIWRLAKAIRTRYIQNLKVYDYVDQLIMLSNDTSIPKYATNLVFLSNAKSEKKVEEKILYSILQTQPKRADIYWFIHIEVTDEPYTMEYKVNTIAPNDIYKVVFRLGFRVEQRMNLFMKKVVEELIATGELEAEPRYHVKSNEAPTGDFKFVLIQEYLSQENDLPVHEQVIMSLYLFIKKLTATPSSWFGLESGAVAVEKVPLVLRRAADVRLHRIQELPK
jgi:KUP system potassium uptake protein